MYTGQNIYDLANIEYTSGRIHGVVVKTQEELGDGSHVGFYIPKLFPLMPATDGPIEETVSIDMSIFANKDEYKPTVDSSVTLLNYMKIKPIGLSNFSQPKIAIGETAYIVFIDGDYKQPRYTYEHNNEVKRATDDVTFFVFSKSDGDAAASDMYKVHLSSKDKKINIHMSADNGETSTYDILLDGAAGELSAFDGEGNTIGINTSSKTIYAKNVSDTEVQLCDKNITANCSGDFSIECDNFNVTAKTNIVAKSNAKVELSAPKINISGTASVDVNTVAFNVTASGMMKCVTPSMLVTGMIGAAGLGVSPAPGAPPAAVVSNLAGATMVPIPRGVAAYGDKTIMVISAMIPFFAEYSGIAAAVVSPMLSMIPAPNIKY